MDTPRLWKMRDWGVAIGARRLRLYSWGVYRAAPLEEGPSRKRFR